MRTLLTKKQQEEFIRTHPMHSAFKHVWSTRGMGSSKYVDTSGNLLGRAKGCGYDRKGTALGNAIATIFPGELIRLSKVKNAQELFYGFFINKDGSVYIDGGCGQSCVEMILNAIGFSLKYIGKSRWSSAGNEFYSLVPVTKYQKERITNIKPIQKVQS